MADWIARLTGETAGVLALPPDERRAARLLRGQVEAGRPVLVITRDTWEYVEPRYGLLRRYAYEVRDIAPGGLVRLHSTLGRFQAQPKPLPIRDLLELIRPEAATAYPPAAHVRPVEDRTGPGSDADDR